MQKIVFVSIEEDDRLDNFKCNSFSRSNSSDTFMLNYLVLLRYKHQPRTLMANISRQVVVAAEVADKAAAVAAVID